MAKKVSVKKAEPENTPIVEAERLTEEILDVILSLASLDFSKTVRVGYEDSNFNAVAAGLNMLGQELQRSVVSKEYVQNIIGSMTDCLIVIDPDGSLRTINGYTYRLLGYEDGELLGKKDRMLTSDENFWQIFDHARQGEQSVPLMEIDVQFQTKDGRSIAMQVNGAVMRDVTGNVSGIVLVARDMTEIRSLIEAREKANHDLQEANFSLGREIETRRGVEEKLRDAHDHLEQLVEERTKDLRKANEQLALEIEERTRAESLARAGEEKYRNIFETTTVSLWEADISEAVDFLGKRIQDGIDVKALFKQNPTLSTELFKKVRIVDVNEESVKMFGADNKAQLVQNFAEIFTPDWSEMFLDNMISYLHGERQTGGETVARNLKGKRLNILVQSRIPQEQKKEGINALVSIIDVTERKELEDQLRQSQKMDAIGRLAGGVAHDFNNLLTVILNYGQMIIEEVPEENPINKKAGAILECAERAAALTHQLLAFSRKQMIEPKILDLNAVISKTEKMLRRLMGEDVNLLTQYDDKIGRVKADANQIEQILMNLAVNARDAMPKGGKLTIETKNVDIGADLSPEHAGIEPGQYVMFAVGDTGEGMSEEIKVRIFEPFFTTKGVGKGTGLGLATVYGNVKQNGGHIGVDSELGVGSTFKIYFPRLSEQVQEVAEEEIKDEALHGTETVLVVEDEENVRGVTCTLLKKHGYNVLEAKSPDDAVGICEKHPGNIDLILTDVVMPNMNGRELVSRLTQVRPKMGVLYMSGYTDNAITNNGVLEPGTSFLQKPFMTKALLSKVREVLGTQAPSA